MEDGKQDTFLLGSISWLQGLLSTFAQEQEETMKCFGPEPLPSLMPLSPPRSG